MYLALLEYWYKKGQKYESLQTNLYIWGNLLTTETELSHSCTTPLFIITIILCALLQQTFNKYEPVCFEQLKWLREAIDCWQIVGFTPSREWEHEEAFQLKLSTEQKKQAVSSVQEILPTVCLSDIMYMQPIHLNPEDGCEAADIWHGDGRQSTRATPWNWTTVCLWRERQRDNEEPTQPVLRCSRMSGKTKGCTQQQASTTAQYVHF